ncbi:MAG: DNA-binding LytR/AlgR family response regulator [Flammeovirgaceae bacterium]|jgi:DNA-binding LytR/AlgR family response regulator
MRCLIIDDEPLAREGIANYAKEIDFLEVEGTCSNPLEASILMGKSEIDLLFLDIQMPKINGIDFLKSLKNPPMVIITTAYPSYALEGYQLDVIDYLLKPITFQRFFQAVNKAKTQFDLRKKSIPVQTPQAETNSEEYFFVKCENKLEKVKISEILFIEGMQNYITIHTESGKYMTLLTLKSMEEKLDSNQFMRVHKSSLVAVKKIDGMEGNELLIASHRISISRTYKDNVMEKLINEKLWKK